MKSFSQFLEDAVPSVATIQGKRLGLTPNGHGDFYNKTGEFVAKNTGGRLKFYTQNQVSNGQDPKQIRTQANQRPVATQVFTKKIKENNNYDVILREKYIKKQIFNDGEIVENLNNGLIGKIIRRGTNYLICVTEDDQMFKSWISDVREYTEVKMDNPMREKNKPNTLVGTTGMFKYFASMTPGAIGTNKQNLVVGQKPYGIKNLNKYKIK